MFLSGYAYFQGVDVNAFGLIRTELQLENSEFIFSIPLGGVKSLQHPIEPNDYSYSQISTISNAGIDLSSIPHGRYSIVLKSSQDELSDSSRLEGTNVTQSVTFTKNGSIRLFKSNDSIVLIYEPLDFALTDDYFFELLNLTITQRKLDIYGVFGPRGYELSNWNSIDYYLLIAGKENQVVRTIRLANGSRDDIDKYSGNSYLDQSKAVFATRRYLPIDLDSFNLPFGEYNLSIAARHETRIKVRNLDGTVIYRPVEGVSKPKVSVIGSCVSRDLFNGKLNPTWRTGYELLGTFYQMSLISLMSDSIPVPEVLNEQMDSHSFACTSADFRKDFLQELALKKPDVLLVDLRIDARFGVLQVGNSWITNNQWKIGQTDYYEQLNDNLRLSMFENKANFIKLFEKSVIKFRDFLSACIPECKIFLNSARGVNFYRNGLRNIKLESSVIYDHNKKWDELDAVFEKNIDCRRFAPEIRFVGSDINHPWGKGPIHYESSYYSDAAALISREIYGSLADYELVQTINS